MAINETIASGKYRQCIDEINKIWKRYSLWNKASDTECEDGQTVEEKVGTIKGITTITSLKSVCKSHTEISSILYVQ